jgi:hypothetical protein
VTLTWTLAHFPGPWMTDTDWAYGVTTCNGRIYRERDGCVEVMTERGWRGIPTLTPENVKLTPDEAVERHAQSLTVTA